ncbi:hypothetical protein B0H14DRAFT_2825843, partial [Mycena olivaceomarginata]
MWHPYCLQRGVLQVRPTLSTCTLAPIAGLFFVSSAFPPHTSTSPSLRPWPCTTSRVRPSWDTHCAVSESAMAIDVPPPAAPARPPYMLLHDIDRRRVVHPPHHYSGIIPTQPIRLQLRSGPHDLATARSGRGEIWAGRARRGTYVGAACCRCRAASYLGSSERRCAQAAGAASLRAPAPERVRPAWGRRSARRCASALGVGTMADVLCELRESLMLHAGAPCAGGRTSCSRRRTGARVRACADERACRRRRCRVGRGRWLRIRTEVRIRVRVRRASASA